MGRIRIPETEVELRNMLIDNAEVAVLKAFAMIGLIDSFVSQREAERQFNQRTVRAWIRKGLLKRSKTGPRNSKIKIDRVELLANSKAAYKAGCRRK